MTVTITRESNSGSYVHTIDVSGVVGAILWLILGAIIMFSISYSSVNWQSKEHGSLGEVSSGLWQRCLCAYMEGDQVPAWHRSVQILSTISVFLMVVCGGCVLVYLYLHMFNKNAVLWAIFITSTVSASILFSVLIVYGIHTGTNQSYGYVFAVFSTVFCALGACLSLIQMHRSSMLGDVDKD